MANKRRQREALVKALKVLGTIINLEADGDHDTLERCGFPFARPRAARRTVQGDIEATPGVGSVSVVLKEHPEAMGYLVQYTEAPVTDKSSWTDVYSSN